MCIKTHILHQKGIPPTIPEDPINDHETETLSKKLYHFLLLLLPLQRNPHPHLSSAACRSPQFAFCNYEPTHYLQSFHLDTSSYRQIQIATHPRYNELLNDFKAR